MKRLTEWRNGHGAIINNTENYIDKLAQYEDAEEQGLLIKLPCKVGDEIFVTDEGTFLPARKTVESITWWNGRLTFRAINNRTKTGYLFCLDDFGKTVFASRNEAMSAMTDTHAKE